MIVELPPLYPQRLTVSVGRLETNSVNVYYKLLFFCILDLRQLEE